MFFKGSLGHVHCQITVLVAFGLKSKQIEYASKNSLVKHAHMFSYIGAKIFGIVI